MNIEEYAKARTKDKEFMAWLGEERIVMYDWSLDAQGIEVSERFNILVEEFKHEKDWK